MYPRREENSSEETSLWRYWLVPQRRNTLSLIQSFVKATFKSFLDDVVCVCLYVCFSPSFFIIIISRLFFFSFFLDMIGFFPPQMTPSCSSDAWCCNNPYYIASKWLSRLFFLLPFIVIRIFGCVAWNVGGDALLLLPSFVSLRYRDTVGFFPDLIGCDCWIARKGIRELFKVIDLFIRRPGVSHHLFSLLLCGPHHTYVHTVSVYVCVWYQ